MLYYLKKYPLTLLVVAIIFYLSFFKPPQTDMENIPGIDKLVHICMYGGLCFLLWVEYLRNHQAMDKLTVFNLGKHIAGDLITAKLSLRQSGLQPCLLEQFAHFHRKPSGNCNLPHCSIEFEKYPVLQKIHLLFLIIWFIT